MTDNSYHNCLGTIVNIGKYGEVEGAEVSWDERQGMKGGQILFHRLVNHKRIIIGIAEIFVIIPEADFLLLAFFID